MIMATKYIFQNTVAVHDENGAAHWFHPGDEAPNWVINLQACDMAHFEVPTDAPEAVVVQEIDYSKLNKTELSDLCAERGLDFDGTKADLLKRLVDADGALG
jgi:hypothetical protein